MADVIRKATNRFTKGLVMDFSPENTKNELLTHVLNATLLTFNGNELSLQNDMGNGRVETAYLPEGYMPVGTCEYGGIIYIVSYNPLEDKSLIGCFPSPERNISSTELGISDISIDKEFFQKFENGIPDKSGKILQNTQYVLLKNDNLNPGDKFLVCANKEIYNEKLADLLIKTDSSTEYKYIHNPVIALNVVSIEESGKIVYLNSDIRLYEITNNYTIDNLEHTDTYKYHILGLMAENNGVYNLATVDPDNYRNVLSSGYSVFKSKTSGKLAILAELIMIDSYSVTHSIYPRKDDFGNIIEGTFDIVIHTEIEPLLTNDNYHINPKLQYYYLENSQGLILTKNDPKRSLFLIINGLNTGKYNLSFFLTKLNDIYEPIDANISSHLNKNLENSGKFNFPKPFTYHGRMIPYTGELTGSANNLVYTKLIEGKYHRINYSQIASSNDLINYYKEDVRAKFYYYDASGQQYQIYTEEEINEQYTYYIRKEDHIYYDVKRDLGYKNHTLYKLITLPLVATDELLKDSTIEKFLKLDIYSYKEATQEEIETEARLYYTEDGGQTYKSLIGSPLPGVTYYILVIETNMVSIGFNVDLNTILGEVYYYPSEKTYEQATEEDKKKYYDFTKYPYESTEPYGSPITLYRLEENWTYVQATINQIYNYKLLGIELYYSTNYILIPEIEHYREENLLFIVVPMDTYLDSTLFIPNTTYNWINGYEKPKGDYPKNDEIYLYTVADFIPDNLNLNSDNYLNYGDLLLGNIQLPSVVTLNGLDLPFKYDYTIVPCMNYGKLLHLAVSNTVDFSKLHAFNQSDFTTWKYRIDDNQLRLTFGAEVFDTYETNKVDGLVLEFYDCWGFAGSLEIVDKKSYSGIFTKLIPLNSLRALSRKKVTANGYSENYIRNINIKDEFDADGNVSGFTFNGEPAVYLNSTNGWFITNKSLSDSSEIVDHNDCGTLYSNVLYGVKTYLRRTTKDGKEFIKKSDFFLYTLPIYNDFYYTVSNFSNLQEPELDLILAYKLKDNSSKSVYNQEGIVSGLNQDDKIKVSNYLSGFYDKPTLDLIKYYLYQGHTDLYLEVGIKKDYEQLNMSYSPDLNKYFSCNLLLISNDSESKTYSVNSGVDGLSEINQILNYDNGQVTISDSVNKLEFITGNTTSITKKNFKKANFITSSGNAPIQINYEFVVGYTASILDIRNTLVQATTICALFHKTPEGNYNYEDFGVYLQSENEENKYLSNIMFYNEGTRDKEVFGICKLIKTLGKNMIDECQSISSVETDAQEIKTAGKLNSGEPLKLLVSNIGKLTFCQPHAHGLSETNGVNLHEGNGTHNYGIPSEEGGGKKLDDFDSVDDTYGIAPRNYLFNHPKYNMCLNTKNSINYNSEFLSTLDYNTISSTIWLFNCDNNDSDERNKWYGPTTVREYKGFTGTQISDFNKKLLKTMSSVYAYNPDYDSLTVNVGNIILLNYNPSFTTNLLSTDSKLNFDDNQTLNDFIYLGPIKFSNYLKYLNLYSLAIDGTKINIETTNNLGKSNILPLLLLVPNYEYCGTKDSNCLISTLNYNTPVPLELEQELEFSSSNITVIKHSNGENTFLEGTPNKKALYGYNEEFNKMIELDVSNYTIDVEGNLKVNSDGAKENKTMILEVNEELNLKLYNTSHNFTETFINSNGENILLNLNLLLNKYGSGLSTLKCGDSSFMIGGEFSTVNDLLTYTLKPSITISNSNSKETYSFSAKITELELECKYNLLNDEVSLYGLPIALYNQDYNVLQILVGLSNEYINIKLSNGTSLSVYSSTLRADSYSGDSISMFINDVYFNQYSSNLTIPVNNAGELKFTIDYLLMGNPENYNYYVVLSEIKIKNIKYVITLTSRLEHNPMSFMSVTKTNNYYKKTLYYTVEDIYKKARIRGSSLTINDLVYEPVTEGHRLFVRNNCCFYNQYLRGKFYYRLLDIEEGRKTWYYNDSKYKNSIFFFTGPSYITENLYND